MIGIKDKTPEEFRKLMHQAIDLISELYHNVGSKKVYRSKSRTEIFELFKEELPKEALDIETLLNTIEKDVLLNTTLHYSPNFYAWVTSNATQASIIGDMIASAINLNATTWLNSPAASEMEQRVIKWIIEFIKYDTNANGILLSGGSMSNFTGLRVAITQNCPYDYYNKGFDNSRPLRIYVSEQNHYCLDKAIVSLGIGLGNLKKIKVDQNFKIDLVDLEQQIKYDISLGYIPLAVIGNAGTVNSGAVDSIRELSLICKKFGLWLHLDAAYGGFAASTKLRDTTFEGLELADSVAIDLHKWLFVPFECGVLLLKNPNHLRESFSFIPEYQKFDHDDLKMDFSEYSMQQSRSFKALKVWMNFKAYGTDNLKQSIFHSIGLMQYLGALIDSSEDFELYTPVSLSVVCFRYISIDNGLDKSSLNKLNMCIVKTCEEEGRIFIRETTLNDCIVLRACCTNFRRNKENVRFLLNELREIGIKNYQHQTL